MQRGIDPIPNPITNNKPFRPVKQQTQHNNTRPLPVQPLLKTTKPNHAYSSHYSIANNLIETIEPICRINAPLMWRIDFSMHLYS